MDEPNSGTSTSGNKVQMSPRTATAVVNTSNNGSSSVPETAKIDNASSMDQSTPQGLFKLSPSKSKGIHQLTRGKSHKLQKMSREEIIGQIMSPDVRREEGSQHTDEMKGSSNKRTS